jgi:tRNA (guanine37-N1)-methyltransferase
MHFHIITMFPDFFSSPFKTGILGKSIEDKKVEVSFYHLVDYKEAPNKRIDDSPFGGGAGMLFRPEPVARAIEAVKERLESPQPPLSRGSDTDSHSTTISERKSPPPDKGGLSPRIPVIHFTPRGKKFTQAKAEKLSTSYNDIILLCGRYEGIDQRVLDMYVDMEYCVGDAILTGGEYPALFFVDAITRLLPGILGNEDSPEEESFSKEFGRKKEYPHYTRPEEWRGKKVPEVLLSGHHKHIASWRKNHLQ